MVMVGNKAPDFSTNAYVKGKIINISPEDARKEGKWLVLCFYPGDFTFV